jgi:hypothetical protein
VALRSKRKLGSPTHDRLTPAPMGFFPSAIDQSHVRLWRKPSAIRGIVQNAESEKNAQMLVGTCHCGKVSWDLSGMPESVTASWMNKEEVIR